MLKEQVDCMPGICEMYIETHMTGDDPDLAMMLANRRNLHALTLSHASPGEDDSEYSEVASDDDEWSDRSEVLEDWEGKPGTKALGDSFLSLALPSLAGLKHLFIMRFDLTEGWGSPDLPCPFNLVTLLFDRVSIKGDLMSWMLAPTCR